MPSKIYIYDRPTETWRRQGAPSITGEGGNPGPDSLYRPVSYSTVAEAREALGAPADANYVVWSHGDQHLEQVFASLPVNTILVLPEREEPYWIDSSNGFMASGVESVDGVNSAGIKDGSRVPVYGANNRLWFSMARIQRGIMGMGPGVTISPTDSGWTSPPWVVLEQQAPGNQSQNRYMTNGDVFPMVGAQAKLIETGNEANPFFANFRLTGRDFGGIQYTGISSDHSSNTSRHTTIKRVFFDGCWRGNAAVPNGETGGLGMLRGTYLIEHCDFRSQNGSSPIMWNRTGGGAMRNTRVDRPNLGMITFWESTGVNVFEDVWVDANTTGVNLEQNRPGFELQWTRGKIQLHGIGTKVHANIQPEHGSIKINFQNVALSPNGFTPNAAVFHVYTTAGVQRIADVTSNTLPRSCVPASHWIA